MLFRKISRFVAVGLGAAALASCAADPAPQTMASQPPSTQTAVAPAPAAPPSVLDTVLARKTLRIGMTGDYKPFTYRNPATGKFEGADVDMGLALAKALGVEAEFVPTTWSTLAADFQAGKFDIAMGGVSITMDRQRIGLFSVPVMVDGKAAIGRCADKAKFNSLAAIDRPTTRAIVNPGGTNERFARANYKHAQLTVYPDNVTIFQQIVDGKADIMVTDASETRYQAKLHPQLCALNPDKPFTFAEKAYWVPRDTVFKAYVDQFVHQAIGDGTYNAILKNWLG